MHWPLGTALILLAASGSGQYAPSFPGGGILAWGIANGTKRNPIGGWLFIFYWQLYSGLILSCVLFATNIQSYVPENFDDTNRYLLFLASTVPGLILFLFQVFVGTMLLSVRAWDMLKLLRWITAAEIFAAIASTAINAEYFPDNLVFNFLTIASASIWLAYLFRSARVKHVFQAHDWDIAVNLIHPQKVKIAS